MTGCCGQKNQMSLKLESTLTNYWPFKMCFFVAFWMVFLFLLLPRFFDEWISSCHKCRGPRVPETQIQSAASKDWWNPGFGGLVFRAKAGPTLKFFFRFWGTAPETEFLGKSEAWCLENHPRTRKWLITMAIVSALRIRWWDLFQMAVSWLIMNGGDPNHLLTGMILQV